MKKLILIYAMIGMSVLANTPDAISEILLHRTSGYSYDDPVQFFLRNLNQLSKQGN